MHRIVIAICTLDRPNGLKRTLAGIARQRLGTVEPSDVAVAVIDNSSSGSAYGTVAAIENSFPYKLVYVREPRRGLARARNMALVTANSEGATLLAFIDDDELPMPTWLSEIVCKLESTGAAAALGPVWPLFDRAPPSWLPTGAYVTEAQFRNERVIAGFTGNVVIALEPVTAAGLRFDLRLDHTGGEDTAFFAALIRAGYTIAWAPQAEVYESVPEARCTLNWLMKRWYRTGLVEAQLAAYASPSSATTVYCLGKGVARLSGGAARLCIAILRGQWRRPDKVSSSLYTLCRGAGYVAGGLGRSHQAYAQPLMK